MAHVWSSRTIDAAQLADLYEWLDRVPLSRKRTNVEKDFADAMLAAELVKYYFPDMIDMRDYRELQNIKDRIDQWNQLNTKIFHQLGLHVPSHVITQLSIAKTGIAQTLLYNLRTCLTLFGANTSYITPVILPEPQPISQPPPVIVRPPVYDDAFWQKYNLRYNLLKEAPPAVFQNEYDYYWQKKQAERVLKSAKSKTPNRNNVTSKSFSHPSLQPRPAILPRLPLNPYVNPTISQVGLAAAKIELDDKVQKIMDKDDEIHFLRGQLKRMEVLLNGKNAKIQELSLELEKLTNRKKK